MPDASQPPATPADGSPSVACLLTPPGRAALAVVGVCGPRALAAVAAYFQPRGSRSLASRGDRSLTFGRWGGPQGEELVVVRRTAAELEVHCHGGVAAAAAILGDLARAGCPQVDATAWLSRCCASDASATDPVAGERQRIAAEARLALATARGLHAARLLGHQLSGRLADAVEALATAEGHQRQAIAEQLLAWQHLGLRLTQPWRVVVAGPPNAGKSSLVNALAGFGRSIVSPTAGTTRDVLETRLVLGGWDLLLIDTAGLRPEAGDRVEQAGIARAVEATHVADLVVVVTACDLPDTRSTTSMLRGSGPRLFVSNKSDLLPAGTQPAAPPGSLHTSTLTGEGLETLATRIIQTLIPTLPRPGDALPFTQRQVDLIRDLCHPRAP